jgi:hypothetical protein
MDQFLDHSLANYSINHSGNSPFDILNKYFVVPPRFELRFKGSKPFVLAITLWNNKIRAGGRDCIDSMPAWKAGAPLFMRHPHIYELPFRIELKFQDYGSGILPIKLKKH